VSIWPGYRLTLSLGRPDFRAVKHGRLWLAATAAAIGLVAVPAFPASAAGNPDPASLSVSVSVVPPAVKSVTLSVSSTTYTNCVYGSSTSTQLGFPNGACVAADNPITVTNGTAPATILVGGADMVPADGGPHWVLCGVNLPCSSSQFIPGSDQYLETVSAVPGYNSGAQQGPGPFVLFDNTPQCDITFAGITGNVCNAAPGGAVSQEFLAMTGPSSSTDSSSTFSTTVTWTAF
jgi:hypothetical protein